MHKNHRDNCELCKLDKEKQEEIGYLYINWVSTYELKRKYNLSRQCIMRHAEQAGWVEQRDKNTKARYRDIAEQEPKDWNSASVVRAIENLDKLAGNVEDKECQIQIKLDGLTLVQIQQEIDRVTKTVEELPKEEGDDSNDLGI